MLAYKKLQQKGFLRKKTKTLIFGSRIMEFILAIEAIKPERFNCWKCVGF